MGDLGSRVWPELWRTSPRPLLIVPIGSCEQHGPHLPLDTDTRIAMALAAGLVDAFTAGGTADERRQGATSDPQLAARLAARLALSGTDSDVLWGSQSAAPSEAQSCVESDMRAQDEGGASMVIAPALAISASGEHAGFPGTLSLGTEVFEQVILELVRSADWSSGVVLVNGHGGNAVAVQRATRTLTSEGRRVLSWWPSDPDGDAHAGITETSLMLAIAPDLVRMHAAAAGRTEPVRVLADQLRAEGVRAVSPNGVLGDPTGATAIHGQAVLTRWRSDLVAAVDEWWT